MPADLAMTGETAPAPAERADGGNGALRAASRDLGDGSLALDLMVPGMHCAGCIRSIERGLTELDEVLKARANLGERRVTVTWTGDAPARITERLSGLGFDWHLADDADAADDGEEMRGLVRALAVAGFAAANVMLLSVSVWSGAAGETRDLFHWLSGLIAVPAVIYAGRPFYRSAWRALAARRLNMDVPISLAVLLALVMSLFETAAGGEHAYFDASVSLLFFLLIGRVLDHLMRRRARRSVAALARLVPDGATVLNPDGSTAYLQLGDIEPGRVLLIRPGDRVPLDARVVSGRGDIDCALVTGESAPVAAGPGTLLQAGTLNLAGVLEAETVARAETSFVARMREMMAAAEASRSPFRKFADRVAEIYAPAVHLLAAVTFAGWMFATGDWREAAYSAIAVLIITCPCALGLAVPIVQVVAAGRLFEAGVLMRDGEALERLAEVDHALFDKTGTLSVGAPVLRDLEAHDPAHLRLAAGLARDASHPLSRALVRAASALDLAPEPCRDVREFPGQGLEGQAGGGTVRLGSAAWCGAEDHDGDATSVHLSVDGVAVARFTFADTDRPDAGTALGRLEADGVDVAILSGDRQATVDAMARRLGVDQAEGALLPADKLARLETLRRTGAKVLMVGDGLNDAPVLTAADVSMTPVTAADIGRAQADFVFLHESLDAVPDALEVARAAHRRVRENVTLAVLYNCVAVPVAVFGLATPLIAAIAMSTSSIIVTANALRLWRRGKEARV